MSEIKKVEQTDIEKLKSLQTQYSELSTKLGQLKIEQLLVNQQVERLKQVEDTFTSEYFKLQSEEQKLAEEISKKYGNGQINIDTGEFIPSV
jgi:peptidoglycan hydrolase CwlO-like protein